jgi:hypothetical protein
MSIEMGYTHFERSMLNRFKNPFYSWENVIRRSYLPVSSVTSRHQAISSSQQRCARGCLKFAHCVCHSFFKPQQLCKPDLRATRKFHFSLESRVCKKPKKHATALHLGKRLQQYMCVKCELGTVYFQYRGQQMDHNTGRGATYR